MRFVKQFLIFAGVISVILFFISFPLPSRVNVSKSVLVNIPKDTVRSFLFNLHEWKHWNPLLQDSSAVYDFASDQQVQWTARDGKQNKIELSLYAADSVFAHIYTDQKKAFESGFSVVRNEDNTTTKIDWWIQEDLGWMPWNKFYGLFSEGLKEEYLERSLQSLKYYLEKNY